MGANYTRPGAFPEAADARAAGATPMRAERADDRTLRNIGLEPAPAPPLFDTALGQTFFKMRTALGASLWDMARLVGTDPTVIANLEAGALEALPAWSELTRIVEAYGALTGTDTAPLLARLIKDYAMTGPAVTQPITAHLPQTAPPAPPRAQDGVHEIVPYDDAPRAPLPPRAGSRATSVVEDVEELADETAVSEQDDTPPRARRIVLWAAAALLLSIAAIVLTARMQPRLLYAAAWPLPQVVRQPLMGGIDWLVVGLAPKRDGLVWIDAGDPAWRKTDKLPEAKP